MIKTLQQTAQKNHCHTFHAFSSQLEIFFFIKIYSAVQTGRQHWPQGILPNRITRTTILIVSGPESILMNNKHDDLRFVPKTSFCLRVDAHHLIQFTVKKTCGDTAFQTLLSFCPISKVSIFWHLTLLDRDYHLNGTSCRNCLSQLYWFFNSVSKADRRGVCYMRL